MNSHVLSILAFILLTGTLFSQSTWSKVYPEIASAGLETVTQVIECPNGDLLLAGGNGEKYAEADAFLMRLDSLGNQLWYKEYPGTHSFASVIRLDNGDFVAGGLSDSINSVSIIMRTDSLGNIIQAVNVVIDYFGNATALVKSQNGIVATADFAWELNDSMTNLNWIGRLQPNGGTNDIAAVPGGYIVAGTGGLLSGNFDVHLTKIDSVGNPLWAMCYGGERGERAKDVVPTQDGGFLIGGWTDSFDAWNRKYFMIKTDSVGTYEWGKTFNDSIYGNFGQCVLEDDAGNFYIGGIHQSFNVMIIKTDSDGNLIWSKTFHSGTAYSMIQSSDGNIVVAGETRAFEYFVFKMDTSGNAICSENVEIAEYDRPFQFITSYAPVGVGNSVTQATVSQQAVTKSHIGCEYLSMDEISESSNQLKVYPNPASEFVQFSLPESSENASIKLYTAQGKLVRTYNIENGAAQKKIAVGEFPNGMYHYMYIDQNGTLARGRFSIAN